MGTKNKNKKGISLIVLIITIIVVIILAAIIIITITKNNLEISNSVCGMQVPERLILQHRLQKER